jgi:ATP-dependent Clp protease ATP-binding subunit ClpC
MYEGFTDRARMVMQLANEEARRFNHEYVGTEHILLGLIKGGDSVATHVLKNLGVDVRKIRLVVEKILERGLEVAPLANLPYTPRAMKVVDYATEESRRFKHDSIGTEHILLGMLREERCAAALILANFGLRLERTREEIEKVLKQPHDWGRMPTLLQFPAPRST